MPGFIRPTLLLIFGLTLSARGVLASDADWKCAPDPKTGHWSCGSEHAAEPQGKELELGEDGTAQEQPKDRQFDPLSGETTGPEDRPEMLKGKDPFNSALAKGEPPKSKVSGWNCEPSADEGEDRSWVCSLTGRDPRGMAHVVSEAGEDDENWSESRQITREDEERFLTLMGKLPTNPWTRLCAVKVGKRLPPALTEFMMSREERLARDTAPTDIDSDFFELIDNEVTTFIGSVHMTQADQELWADFITRNLTNSAVNTHGNVVYKDKTQIMMSDSAHLKGDGRGVFRNSQFILPQVPGRGTSRVTYLDSAILSRYETFSYTTCPSGNQNWVLHADNVIMNKDTGFARAHNAWFSFYDLPVFWTPVMSFPIDGRRMSGLLSPVMGYSQINGFNLAVPYYFDIAPNMDATVQARYLSERGYMSLNEFRYLSDTSRGKMIFDIVPYDTQTKTTRGQFGFQDSSAWMKDLTSQVDLNYVSDANYLAQLGSPLSMIDTNNITSRATVNYSAGEFGNVNLMANYYQTINPAIPKNAYPYFYLPKLEHNWGTEILDTGLTLSNTIQMADIQADSSFLTTGQRFIMRPKLQLPVESSWGFFKPSATLIYNQYSLQNTGQWQALQQANGVAVQQTDTPNFTVPILSMDAGTYFDRDFDLGGQTWQQTIEPRLFYVYIPYTNQSDIPVFDTTPYDFTYYQMFRENRYTGNDRIGDTNQMTAALTSRIIDGEKGYDRFRATIGNIAYFDNRQVTTIGTTPSTYAQSFSNLVGDVYAGITEDWSIYNAGQYNASQNVISRGQVGLTYNNRQNQILNMIYRYRLNQNTNTGCPTNATTSYSYLSTFSECLNLTDVSFRLPLFEGWHMVGRWEYSFLNNTTLETFFGVERETCCYKFAVIARRYLNTISSNGTAQSNDAIYVQLDLKGLSSVNADVDKFLQRTIMGYRYQDY
ncbi:MAG TPA: LPS-assembly protein LptD [Methylococcaceae bacterium]|jgi:LPS-assembly protein|nr:LPS-assembly protein LptD [Methylococcaceae bacterium]